MPSTLGRGLWGLGIRGFAFMRYINPRFTLTLTLTYKPLNTNNLTRPTSWILWN